MGRRFRAFKTIRNLLNNTMAFKIVKIRERREVERGNGFHITLLFFFVDPPVPP